MRTNFTKLRNVHRCLQNLNATEKIIMALGKDEKKIIYIYIYINWKNIRYKQKMKYQSQTPEMFERTR